MGSPFLGAPLAAPAPAPAPVSNALATTARSAVPTLAGGTDVPRVLAERIELARFLADANLLPGSLRKQPANLLLVMHRAMALDLPLSVAIEHMHVIDGQVGQSAELLRGLLYRAGHILRWGTVNETEATAELVLRHDPKHPRVERFTIADAQRMKLTGKDNWTKDPASMLVARVTTRLVSRHCPEIALAIGNLSAVDVEPEPAAATTATATTAPTAAVVGTETATPDGERGAAASAADNARRAHSMQELMAIGTQAREQGLLDVAVTIDGTEMPLQQALLRRVAELRAQADTEPAEPAATAPAEPAAAKPAAAKPAAGNDKAATPKASTRTEDGKAEKPEKPQYVRPSQRSRQQAAFGDDAGDGAGTGVVAGP